MTDKPSQTGFGQQLRKQIDFLYNGASTRARNFRWGLLAFDGMTILYFVVGSFFPSLHSQYLLEQGIGIIYLLEFCARLSISKKRLRDIFHPVGLADLIVIASLLVPSLLGNLSFLRVLRSLRLLRSYRMLKNLRGQSTFVRLHEDIIFSIVNLLVFIFVITAIVYVSQVGVNPDIKSYVDALYFTISTLTTTGFGDITLIGTSGHLLAVLIMIFGISLFLRLIQTIFRPEKIPYECPTCGLNRHDIDAVHCKHCGQVLRITTEGSN
ncbi:Ion transport 2 domain protein [Psychromonas ingrahamii 37]|uniref:Ion transport 2 domain protein n=1 Tax=Psychromonas ingrahamii (strain DSM 17664 / CCUG 51855 / 37) TaxID=357804 RepID=A1SVS6_PSYIN|nr:potassium channel family protein [Psychromonas ingrahamii]ABM03591.1 Ion transport 2 domain protein [Psychromonas ingrahamii 37]